MSWLRQGQHLGHHFFGVLTLPLRQDLPVDKRSRYHPSRFQACIFLENVFPVTPEANKQLDGPRRGTCGSTNPTHPFCLVVSFQLSYSAFSLGQICTILTPVCASRFFLAKVYSLFGNDVDIHLNTVVVWLLRVVCFVFLFNSLQECASLYFYPLPSTEIDTASTLAEASMPLKGQNQLTRINPVLKSSPDTRSIPSPVRSPPRSRPSGLSSSMRATPQRFSTLNFAQQNQVSPNSSHRLDSSTGLGSPVNQRMTPLQQAISLAAQTAAAEDASLSADWAPPNNSFDQSIDFDQATGSMNTNLFGGRSSGLYSSAPTQTKIIPPWSAPGTENVASGSTLSRPVNSQIPFRPYESRSTPSAAEGDNSWADDGADNRLIESLRSHWAASDAAEAAAAASAQARVSNRSGAVFRPPWPRLRAGESELNMRP